MKYPEENHLHFDEHNTVAFGLGVGSSPFNKVWAQSMETKNMRLKNIN
jgi:hypothetical protein